jgi:hypothetical protein
MNIWVPWIYHYGLGTLLFSAGVGLAIKSNALQLKRRIDRRILFFLVAGLVLFMSVHALWIAAVVAGGEAP